MLFALPDGLALAFPVSFVTYDILQILVGIDVLAAYNLRGIGNYIFRQSDFTGYLYGERTARIAYLELE